jgi:hypothetical protein
MPREQANQPQTKWKKLIDVHKYLCIFYFTHSKDLFLNPLIITNDYLNNINNSAKNGHGGGRTLDRCVISTTL